jgi:hypothetical protein
MATNDDLARWGQPPATPTEEALAAFLDTVLQRRAAGQPARPEALLPGAPDLTGLCTELLQAVAELDQFVTSVLEHSGVAGSTPWGEGSTEIYDPSSSPDSDLPDPFPSDFRVRALLGEGTFGKVWLADDLHLGIPVALKTLRVGTSPTALAALRNEARLLAQLLHPNIVRVYSWRQAGPEHYLVLQYVAGGSFEARVKGGEQFTWRQAARYIADVGEALQQVHARGIVHRDIKAANILWDPDKDEALLTDFGVAGRLTDRTTAAGTPLFMAPEAFEGQATPAGDVYGLGATLFHLATGEAPFPAGTRADLLRRIRQGLPDPDPRCRALPAPIERLIRSALDALPERRPSLRDFVATLRGSLNQLLADALSAAPAGRQAAPDLRIQVCRWLDDRTFAPVATTNAGAAGLSRNMTVVPPSPERVILHTGDLVRVEVVADRDGYVTVFNIGPTGDLTLLYPEQPQGEAPLIHANRPVQILEVVMKPPTGTERLFAVWSRVPLPLEKMLDLARGDEGVSRSYRATRNMERVKQSMQQLRREDWHTVVLELDHCS